MDERTEDRVLVEHWLSRASEALRAGSAAGLRELLLPDAYWRDILALTWDLHTFYGIEQIEEGLHATLPARRISELRLRADVPVRRVVRAGREALEAVFEFATSEGGGAGVVRLVSEPGAEPWGWTVFTALQDLDVEAVPTPPGAAPGGPTERYHRDFAGPNWLDQRRAAERYDDREPEVLVVGAGQAGLGVAARLRHLGVDALVVDRIERVGDNWRKRYHSLVLHNEVWANHLPFMEFPATWPTYIPKDMLAAFFEAYATFMELNVWTGTEFLGGQYDDAVGEWAVQVRRTDGTVRELRPKHVVMAVGVSGIPYVPALPGIEEFGGEVLHSSAFENGSDYQGRRVLVVGTGTSGHDVAQDLYSRGAEVTLVQHGPTTVVSVGPHAAGRVYNLYREGLPTEVTDLINIATPYPVMRHGYQLLTRELAEQDRELLDGLRAVGFQLDSGSDATGFQMKYMRTGGGYYLDVGCSGLIVDGKVRLRRTSEIEGFDAAGVRLSDGGHEHVDVVILATGYKGQQELVARLFGPETAERAGAVWGFDDEGELRNMWRRTGQPGLWFTAGSLAQSRIFSRYLALQLRACLTGALDLVRPADAPRGVLRDRDLVDVWEVLPDPAGAAEKEIV
ncbi:NAD(P)/FAD-dependent oxidoreductase [Pseudonocardia sp. NPDC046786]|uniref:flavin-containing monooxygenase n=1 Tax=Pseudonocardia sp. NPDC046786 TaxID=3155471 RepID=UPI0033F1BE9C